jgi:hypothetical protein
MRGIYQLSCKSLLTERPFSQQCSTFSFIVLIILKFKYDLSVHKPMVIKASISLLFLYGGKISVQFCSSTSFGTSENPKTLSFKEHKCTYGGDNSLCLVQNKFFIMYKISFCEEKATETFHCYILHKTKIARYSMHKQKYFPE